MKDCNRKCISFITLIISVIIVVQTNLLTIMLFNLKTSVIEEQITKKEAYEEKLVDEQMEKLLIVILDILKKHQK